MPLVIGCKVKISSCNPYDKELKNQEGVIEKIFAHGRNKYGVRLFEKVNKNSSYGLFWFSKNDIEPIFIQSVVCDEFIEKNEGDEVMLDKDFNVATISFLTGSNTNVKYFYALYSKDISAGDMVVVKTKHHGFALAKIAEIYEKDTEDYDAVVELVSSGREVICKVNLEDYNERIKKRERVVELKKALDEKVKKMQTYAVYELLAEKDPALKELLEEYKLLVD